jgi:hypothetical protein
MRRSAALHHATLSYTCRCSSNTARTAGTLGLVVRFVWQHGDLRWPAPSTIAALIFSVLPRCQRLSFAPGVGTDRNRHPRSVWLDLCVQLCALARWQDCVVRRYGGGQWALAGALLTSTPSSSIWAMPAADLMLSAATYNRFNGRPVASLKGIFYFCCRPLIHCLHCWCARPILLPK